MPWVQWVRCGAIDLLHHGGSGLSLMEFLSRAVALSFACRAQGFTTFVSGPFIVNAFDQAVFDLLQRRRVFRNRANSLSSRPIPANSFGPKRCLPLLDHSDEILSRMLSIASCRSHRSHLSAPRAPSAPLAPIAPIAPRMLPVSYLVVFIAAFIAGAINSVAGGGTLVSFPALVWVGLPSTIANATSTVAIWPGSLGGVWGYRHDLHGLPKSTYALIIPSLIGGILGAVLLVMTPTAVFDRLIPLLILFATLLFMLQDPVQRMIKTTGKAHSGSNAWLIGAMLFQFLVSVYGGYFGAGIGILMLAAFGIMGFTDIHQMNGLKNFLALCINGVAAVVFHLERHGVVAARARDGRGRDRRRRVGRGRRPPHRPERRSPHRHHRRLHDGDLPVVQAVGPETTAMGLTPAEQVF